MLAQEKLPRSLWGETLNMAVYISNRIPTRGVKGEVSPYKIWYSRAPELSYMRAFRCNSYAHVQGRQGGKLDSKAEKYKLVGCSVRSRGFRLYNEAKREVVIKRDVIFDENDVLRKEAYEGYIKSECTSDDTESRDKDVSGSTNEPNEDLEASMKSDMVELKVCG